ncbi:GAF domain-containing SpoIIE family protein phosphatase [Paraoerskovia marina]|uniref:GAF domain-containing SpoIIE family protein phosphatase n=1 Tax=Paraoerskovia marina TaxID=545619 RepID=UPI0006939B6A|nr:GAF domain-containing SpoIIE family protein phosphatase [Paraoerskovia marina]
MTTYRPPARELPHRAALSLRAALEARVALSLTEVRDGRDTLVWISPEFERMSGYNADDLVGQDMSVLQCDATDRADVDRLHAGLLKGETVRATLRNRRWDGSEFWNRMVISPVYDDEGTLTHHVGYHTDATADVEAVAAHAARIGRADRRNERMHLLAEITQELTTVLDMDEGASRLADLVAQHFGDWVVVVLADRDNGVGAAYVSTRRRSAGQLAAARPLAESTAWVHGSPALLNALRGGETLVAQPFDINSALIDQIPDARHRTSIRRLGASRAIAVTLQGREGPLGALGILSRSPDAMDDDDAQDLVHLGARAGLALENARLYQREHEVAVTLQRSLLPRLVDVPGLDCAATYEPASDGTDVGGDWYDVVPLPQGGVSVSVGDVVGHDIAAAAAMGQLRSSLRVEAWAGHHVAEAVDSVDHLVQTLGMTDLATCVLAQIDAPDSDGLRRLHYVRAGHLTPFLIDPDGTVVALDGALTTPLGVPTRGDVSESTVDFVPGAVLVLYTDGLVERRDRPLPAGIAELRAAAEALPPGLTAREVADQLVRATTGQREDDTCILVVRNLPAG